MGGLLRQQVIDLDDSIGAFPSVVLLALRVDKVLPEDSMVAVTFLYYYN